MIKTHPIKGIGYGMSEFKYQEYAERNIPAMFQIRAIHNWFINVWAEMGIFGFLVFCGLNFYLMFACWRRFRQLGPVEGKCQFFAFVALLVLMINATIHPNYDYENIYWIVVAIGVISVSGKRLFPETSQPSGRIAGDSFQP